MKASEIGAPSHTLNIEAFMGSWLPMMLEQHLTASAAAMSLQCMKFAGTLDSVGRQTKRMASTERVSKMWSSRGKLPSFYARLPTSCRACALDGCDLQTAAGAFGPPDSDLSHRTLQIAPILT